MDNCPICKYPLEILVSSFDYAPFIDGKKYKHICFTCYCVPKSSNNSISQDHLHTVSEMIQAGFSKDKAKASIGAVKRSVAANRGKEYSTSLYRYGVVLVPNHEGGDSIHVIQPDAVKPAINPLQCQACGKVCTSTSGYTLHSKFCKG